MDHVTNANTAQTKDPSFKKEFEFWVRFNEKSATSHGDGFYGNCKGNPACSPIIGKLIFNFEARASFENKSISKQVEILANFSVFVLEQDDPCNWFETDSCYEQFALCAAVIGIRNAFLNQTVEEAYTRPPLSVMMGLKELERPDLIVLFGKILSI